MVLDRVLAAARDQDDVVDAGGDGLFHAVLNDRFVDEWQHLFGLRLGGREKACAESGGGEDRLADCLPSGIRVWVASRESYQSGGNRDKTHRIH